MINRIRQDLEIIGGAIKKYRKWFWLIGLVSLSASFFGDSAPGMIVPFVSGIVFFALAMGIDNFFRQRPFNQAGFALCILGAYIMACLLVASGAIIFSYISIP